ncbi:hypothetical protein [Pseudaminobacter sp. NGMCC 1.201702]|uniref:hypothetical protein n=1 Tax=Pseudaminobacter sp. NGMCC 1.201702 TaxID=3391825 RepID=UPI0039EE48AB
MAEAGHNSGMAEKDQQVLFFINRNEYVRLLEAKKAADAALRNHGKQIKADLGENGMRQIKLYEELRTPEGEAKFKAQRAADAQAAAWAGLPVNTQADMFSDLAPLDERAFNVGEEAGLRGDTLANPYDENSHHGREFKRGWESGQAKLAEGIKQKKAEASTTERIVGDDAGPADEDDADPFEDAEAA